MSRGRALRTRAGMTTSRLAELVSNHYDDQKVVHDVIMEARYLDDLDPSTLEAIYLHEHQLFMKRTIRGIRHDYEVDLKHTLNLVEEHNCLPQNLADMYIRETYPKKKSRN